MIRALFGGSFDPPHNGHLAMIKLLQRDHLVDVVHICPAWLSPHKSAAAASAADRLRMSELAFADLAGVEILSDEIDRGGVSYTIDTLGRLAVEYAEDSWRLAIGADNLAVFDAWHRPREIVDLARLIVFPRDGRRVEIPPDMAAHCDVIRDFDEPVSSTLLRTELEAGRTPVDDLAPAVLKYILAHGLYGAGGGNACH